MQNPVFFTIILINRFPKPCVFSVGLNEYGLAAVQWIAAPAADFSQKACKNWGSGNMRKKKHVKTQGSAPGTLQNLVFYSTFLSVSKTPMEVSRYICSLGAVPGASWTARAFGELLGALKKEASVDYSLRMERLLSRSGWVEGLWRERWRELEGAGGSWRELEEAPQRPSTQPGLESSRSIRRL